MAAETPRLQGTQSARRALEALFYFDARHPDVTVDELAKGIGIPLPSAYRYVALMREMNIVAEGPSGTYHLTARVLSLKEALGRSKGLLTQARPVLEHLSKLSGETALLVQLAGRAAVCMDRVESAQPMRLTYEPGQAVSLQQGASARVLIAGLSPEQRAAHLDWLASRDPAFAERRAQFESEIERTRQEGWAISHGEIDAGIVAVSAPVRVRGLTVAAISIAGPAFRVAEGELDLRRHAVLSATAELSRRLEGEDTEDTGVPVAAGTADEAGGSAVAD